MKALPDIKIIVVLSFLINSFIFYGQANYDQKEYYKWFDSIVGDGNISLYNGIDYREKYRTLKGNYKFYRSSEFLIGDIIYENQSYYDIEMKYDIYDDQLIVKLPSQSGFNFIQLNKEHIVSFNFGSNKFVKISETINKKINTSIFYEELFKSSVFTFYKDHNKIRNRRFLDKGFRYSVFKDQNTYYLHYKNNLYPVKSKRDFIKIFPELKKEIITFHNTNRILSESNFDSFIKMLAKMMSNKINTDNK